MKCTWKECSNEGKFPQLDKDQKQWAFLCEEHHIELEDAIDNFNAKKLLSCWVKAQGGAEKAAKRV